MARKLSSLEIEKKKTLKIAKQLTYTRNFPEIKDKINNAKTSAELDRIMCTYRNYLIKKEYEEYQSQKERKEKLWIKM